MKLYMTPGSCSTGIHILLEEIDRPFAAYIVNLPAGDHEAGVSLPQPERHHPAPGTGKFARTMPCVAHAR